FVQRCVAERSRQTMTSTVTYATLVRALGRRGSQYLPRLAGWFRDITTNFSEWLTAKDASGELDEFINVGIDQLKEFGRVIAETGGILSGLARAADRAGGSTLASLAEKLASIHAIGRAAC